MLCSCTQALLINNFQSDQKSHLIFVLSPLPAPSASVNYSSDMCMPRLSLSLHRCSGCRPIGLAGRQSFCYPCLLLSFHYCYFMHHIHSSSSSALLSQPSPSLSLFAPIDSCCCCLTRNFTCRRAKIIHSKKVALIYD